MDEPIVPYVRRAWYAVLEPNHYIKERVLFDYEILYIKDGQALITLENIPYMGKTGDIFIFRPQQKHSIRVLESSSLIQPHVHFDLLYRPNRAQIPVSYRNMDDILESEMDFFHFDMLDEFFSPFPSILRPHTPKHMELLLFELIHEFENPSLFSEIKLTRLFLRLWEQILSEISYLGNNAKETPTDYAQKLKFYIDQHLSQPLSMDELSKLMHLSKSHCFRLFQQSYNITPLQYHSLLRIQKAKSMIRNTNLSISELSDHLGFSCVQDFCRVFKKIDGSTPTTYRH